MTELPATGYVREKQLLGDPNAQPPLPPIYPVSRSTWWAGVKSGRYPKPHKISARCTAWRVEDVRRLIEAEAA